LVNLSIAYNDLTSITPGAFFMRPVGLPRLHQLSLAGNKISSISSGDFSGGLSELTYLDLRDNQLVTIPSDAFILLGKLTTLYLGYNHILDISS
jgi:Leucine-rich repeat (LRR) protein